ncbi:ROS/MUCR transcriptional regulator domain protein, partial [Klebsiella pneumoniae]
VSHSRQCRENVLNRIRRGEINPDEQLALMAEGRKHAPERATSTRLHKVAARNVAQTHQIWKHSPVVKVVPEALRAEAVKRMEARKVTGEKVKAIAADLNLSVGCLYKWVSAAKQTVN